MDCISYHFVLILVAALLLSPCIMCREYCDKKNPLEEKDPSLRSRVENDVLAKLAAMVSAQKNLPNLDGYAQVISYANSGIAAYYVYGIMWCFAGVPPTVCIECINNNVDTINIANCPLVMNYIVAGDSCVIRYAIGTNFIGNGTDDFSHVDQSPEIISGASFDKFSQEVLDLLVQGIEKAVKWWSNYSIEEKIISLPHEKRVVVRAQSQCSRDLLVKDQCKKCLSRLLVDYIQNCKGHMSCTITAGSCVLKYSSTPHG
ncbi:Cysteine-rich repeat secretory protein 4 [Apostasia shenzhenica]|uniref:Cysteine-rich repeat secretory protein 4 n=1 Tax=Apostasia shenzhenica TaxID=1088818 RepID=A0A2I0APW1_9ASPA|nr:Cysteine-rich repeat secretory protein 4 [Apostasia shenzhenica]